MQLQIEKEALSKEDDEKSKERLEEINKELSELSERDSELSLRYSKEKEDISEIKQKLKVRDIPFSISKDTLEDFQSLIEMRCKNIYDKWEKEKEVDQVKKNKKL